MLLGHILAGWISLPLILGVSCFQGVSCSLPLAPCPSSRCLLFHLEQWWGAHATKHRWNGQASGRTDTDLDLRASLFKDPSGMGCLLSPSELCLFVGLILYSCQGPCPHNQEHGCQGSQDPLPKAATRKEGQSLLSPSSMALQGGLCVV